MTIAALCLLASTLLSVVAQALPAQAPAVQPQAAQATGDAPPYETLFYPHDGLRLEAYLYKPARAGPFPLVVYNHGSAPPGEEAREYAATWVARLLVPAGYALLVPERRGYGKSEGRPFSDEIGQDRGAKFVARHQSEAGDINAAVEYVLSLPGTSIDPKRVAVIGYSFGGIVTAYAASRSTRFAAVVLQAPGALNWNRSEDARTALLEAAGRIRTPTLCTVAENDATTESAQRLCAAARANGAKTIVKIYPPFTSGQERPGNAPGHALFGRLGAAIWEKDLFAFLADAMPR